MVQKKGKKGGKKVAAAPLAVKKMVPQKVPFFVIFRFRFIALNVSTSAEREENYHALHMKEFHHLSKPRSFLPICKILRHLLFSKSMPQKNNNDFKQKISLCSCGYTLVPMCIIDILIKI